MLGKEPVPRLDVGRAAGWVRRQRRRSCRRSGSSASARWSWARLGMRWGFVVCARSRRAGRRAV